MVPEMTAKWSGDFEFIVATWAIPNTPVMRGSVIGLYNFRLR